MIYFPFQEPTEPEPAEPKPPPRPKPPPPSEALSRLKEILKQCLVPIPVRVYTLHKGDEPGLRRALEARHPPSRQASDARCAGAAPQWLLSQRRGARGGAVQDLLAEEGLTPDASSAEIAAVRRKKVRAQAGLGWCPPGAAEG